MNINKKIKRRKKLKIQPNKNFFIYYINLNNYNQFKQYYLLKKWKILNFK